MNGNRSLYDVIQEKERGRVGRPQCRACGVITRPCPNQYCGAQPYRFKEANGNENGDKMPRRD